MRVASTNSEHCRRRALPRRHVTPPAHATHNPPAFRAALPPPPRAQARTVLELLRAFYSDDEDYKAVHEFNHNPSQFDFQALLAKTQVAAAAAAASAAGTAATAAAGGAAQPPPPQQQ